MCTLSTARAESSRSSSAGASSATSTGTTPHFGSRTHLHHVAHFGFPKHVWTELFEQQRIDYHPVFPGRPGFGARRIEGEDDVRDVIELLRLNYDRVVDRHGTPVEA